MTSLSSDERESVAIGAAIGAGCRPCTQYHLRAALKAGLSEEDIRLAVDEAEVLRIEAASSIAEFARGLLDREERRAGAMCNPGGRLQALVQLGAATGANAGHLLDALLPQARGLGVTNDALLEAVELATGVKRMAAEFFGKDAQRALGREDEVAFAGPADSCMEVGAAAIGRGADRAPQSCC